ncbi:hypothetical protein MNB_SV-4-1434 [hydrothermal vent metagenome]|uniref:DUF4357 domain-containing protein n=1 Tax=hydrothermal vent metagenome TaxID=652676 RepID=A0A1W1E9W0_9ZZZZ
MYGKKFGKTIKLFLLDGIPNGRMTCELSNWTGKAYKIPRNKIKNSSDRSELEGTGVYLLFGKSDDENKKVVYIGEVENIYKRLLQHLSEKDYWNEAVTFISKDDNLNKAHIKYLENRLHQSAIEVNRYKVKNANTPTLPSISEPDKAEMEEFLQNVKMIVNILGFKAFEDIREQSNENNIIKLKIEAARGANAIGEQTSDGFVVLKGSKVATSITKSFPQGFKKLRDKLILDGVIVDHKFKKDYLFSSPSAAAAIVMGRSANGLTEWVTEDGRVLKSIESGQ